MIHPLLLSLPKRKHKVHSMPAVWTMLTFLLSLLGLLRLLLSKVARDATARQYHSMQGLSIVLNYWILIKREAYAPDLESCLLPQVNRFDKVLIDGRARAFCAEYVLKYLHADSLVFIHDYHDRFFYHGTIEKYYNKVRHRIPSHDCFPACIT